MKSFVNFIKGIFIGIAAVIPGLSGSIFAVTVGLYDKLVNAVNSLKSNFKKSVLFLIPIAIGGALGVLISTKAVLWVCETYAGPSYALFIGLVLGSVPLVLNKMRQTKFRPTYILFPLISFSAITALTLLINENESSYVAIREIYSVSDALIIFGAGIFSCSLMAVPGVSGSVMLMVMNQYGTVYNAVSSITSSWHSIAITIIFALGAIVGFLGIAKFLSWALDKYNAQTYYCVLGLIFGAVFSLIYNGLLSSFTGLSAGKIILQALIYTGFAAIGFLVVKKIGNSDRRPSVI